MTAWSFCRNSSAADGGCVSGGRHRPLLHRAAWGGAASWPTPWVHGVRQLFGGGLLKLEDETLSNGATTWPFIPAGLTNSISQPALRHAILIWPTARGRTV